LIRFVDGLRRFPHLRIVPSDSLLDEGWRPFCTRLDKEWSLTDCTSMIVMGHEQITLALTSDHHFEQAGFTTLL
jgi:predicted nucleic acid-binding protein